MKQLLLLIAALTLVFAAVSCKEKPDFVDEVVKEVEIVTPDFDKAELDEKFGSTDTYIVKTYLATPQEYIDEVVGDGLFIRVTHYQLSDGTWKTDDYTYKYKLIVSGRMNNAVKDSTYHILSNREIITFDEAWKAAGFSSNSEDYFKPEDAIIVAFE